MDEPTRSKLLFAFRMALAMLPRYLRHDLWRVAEPHHQRAVDRIAETLAAKVDEDFEIETRAARRGLSVADILGPTATTTTPPGQT